jgi:hypothetical protein
VSNETAVLRPALTAVRALLTAIQQRTMRLDRE